MAIAMLALAMFSLSLADDIGLGVIWRNRVAFYAYVVASLMISGWAVSFAAVRALKLLFRIVGMMTKEEARSFPLRAVKRDVDPWPESWQQPCEPLSCRNSPTN